MLLAQGTDGLYVLFYQFHITTFFLTLRKYNFLLTQPYLLQKSL